MNNKAQDDADNTGNRWYSSTLVFLERTADVAIGLKASTSGFTTGVYSLGNSCTDNVLKGAKWLLHLEAPHSIVNYAAAQLPHINWYSSSLVYLERAADMAIGMKAGTIGFTMRVYSLHNTCRVNVLKGSKWLLRLDAPHPNLNFAAAQVPHININPKLNTRLSVDPHWAIPGGKYGLKAAETTAIILKKADKVLLSIAITLDVLQEGVAIYKDVQNNTSRNTVETTASIAGGWTGGSSGAAMGALLGGIIFPGIGPIVGGVIGGVTGGISGRVGGHRVAEAICDAYEYDMVAGEKPCDQCHKEYKFKKYHEQDNGYCGKC